MLDRHLQRERDEARRLPDERGTWVLSMPQLWPDNLAAVNCSWWCPWFMQTRLFIRMGTKARTATAAFLFAAFLLPILGTLSISIEYTKDSTWSGLMTLVVIIQVLALSCTIGITFLLRKRVREANGIAGSAMDDVLMAVFCGPCALAQMERQTQALVPGAHAAWQEELGLPLPKPEELGQVQEQLPTPQDGYVAVDMPPPPPFQPQRMAAAHSPPAQGGDQVYFQVIEASSGL